MQPVAGPPLRSIELDSGPERLPVGTRVRLERWYMPEDHAGIVADHARSYSGLPIVLVVWEGGAIHVPTVRLAERSDLLDSLPPPVRADLLLAQTIDGWSAWWAPARELTVLPPAPPLPRPLIPFGPTSAPKGRLLSVEDFC